MTSHRNFFSCAAKFNSKWIVPVVFVALIWVPSARADNVNISLPTPGSSVSSPFTITASCSVSGANAIQAYLDGTLIYNQNATSMNYQATASIGSHQLTVKCWAGSASYTSSVSFSVVNPPAPVTVTTPAANSTVSSPFTITASCGVSGANAIQAYLDGTLIYNQNATSMNYQVSTSAGTHQLVVKCWAGSANYTSTVGFTVAAPQAPVTVVSPAANSTVSSPFNINASCGATGTTAIQAYLDGTLIYNQNAISMNDQVTASSGGHQLEVKCWAGSAVYSSGAFNFTVSAGTGFNGSSNIPNPPSPPTLTGIQDLSNWTAATGAVSSCPNGVPSSSCNPPNANFDATVVQSTDPVPLSGSSDRAGVFELYQSPSWATVIWGHSLFTSTTARNFIWDFYVYVNATNYYSSELDLYTNLNNGQRFMMGSQCNRVTNSWDTWSESTQAWTPNTSIPCDNILTAGTWHHVSFYSTVDSSNNTYTYHVIRVDGVDYVLNQTQAAKYVGWQDGLVGVQVQLDANASGSGVNEYIENMQLYSW